MTAEAPARRPVRGRRLARLAIALALLAAIVAWVEPARLGAVLRQIHPGWVAAGLLSSTLANALSAWRWRALAAWLGHVAPLPWALAVYFRGVAANVVLPGAVVGGDMVRAWGLHRRGMPVLEAGVSVVLDRISGLWGLVLLGALALAAQLVGDGAAGWAAVALKWGGAAVGGTETVAALAVIAALVMALLPYAALRATPALVGGGLLHRPSLRWWGSLASNRPGWHSAQQLAGSVAVQAASVTTLYCGAQAVGVALPWAALAVAAVPIFVSATLPVSFGGWGTREAAAVAVLALLGVEPSAAVAISVLYGLYPVAQSVLALLPAGQDGPSVASPPGPGAQP
ncbi:MAG: lysylphosphatidylglycerol synthase transmembrane domain-containing protein [Pseudomonadota bacterium]